MDCHFLYPLVYLLRMVSGVKERWEESEEGGRSLKQAWRLPFSSDVLGVAELLKLYM